MAAVQTNRLVGEYLNRLDAAAAGLPRARRVELVAEIREHVSDALRGVEATDEVAVRNVLERLGPPEEIAQAAIEPSSERPGRVGGFEIVALAVLALGFLVPLVGWLAGAALVVASRAWSARDKVIGLLIMPVPFVFLAAAASFVLGSAALGPMELGFLTLGLGGLPAVAYLGWRLANP